MNPKPIKAKNVLGEVRYYPSIAEAARDLETHPASIRRSLQGALNATGRMGWRYWEITQEEYERKTSS